MCGSHSSLMLVALVCCSGDKSHKDAPKGRTCALTHFSLPHFDFFRTNSYMIIGEMSFLFSEYSSLRNSVFSRKSSTSSDVGKYIQCTVKFPFGRNGG